MSSSLRTSGGIGRPTAMERLPSRDNHFFSSCFRDLALGGFENFRRCCTKARCQVAQDVYSLKLIVLKQEKFVFTSFITEALAAYHGCNIFAGMSNFFSPGSCMETTGNSKQGVDIIKSNSEGMEIVGYI
jgi:hypothetical protein